MRLLLDTHTFLYAINFWERLGPRAKVALTDPQNERWVSSITLVEIAIKVSIGKLPLPVERGFYLEHLQAIQAGVLAVEARHCFPLFSMELHHKDPFDRLLIAQAKADNLTILTQDRAFAAYKIPTLW